VRPAGASPSADVLIRSLAPADISAVAALLETLAHEYILHEFAPEARAQFLSKNNADSIRGLVEKGFRYHVATVKNRIVGFVGTRDNSHLYHLFVANEFQRQGLGRRLWNTARSECVAAGNTGTFTVNSSNNSIPVYERFGFVRSGPAQNMSGVIYNPMALRSPSA
jgi:ribosomal protein S18 acetylase RimI-like enzyme